MIASTMNADEFTAAKGPGELRLPGALRHLLLIALGATLVILSGCKSVAGPDYKRPELPQKSDWVSGEQERKKALASIEPGWWKGFGDPQLDQLIVKALQGDFDLKILALRIEQAGIGIQARKDQSFQRSINASISDQFEKKSGEAVTDNRQYGVSAQLNWEIDIWGKVRKGVQAKEAQYKASEADWRAGYLTLVSNIATKYFEILQFDEQIRNQGKTLETQQRLLAIYQAQLKEGLIPQSRLLSQKAEINTLERERLELERQRKVAEFNLASLMGIPAGTLSVPEGNLTQQVRVMTIPSGLPSDLLSRRPDILAHEYRVLAAHHLTGEARLARLPSFSLTANAGLASGLLSSLLKSWTFGLAPSIKIPIFDPNINRNIQTQTLETKIAEENYRKSVITAFEEVETALVNLDYRKRQKRQLEEQVENLRVVRDVQYAQLKEGLVSQLEVFETDRSLLNAEQSVLTAHQQILTDTVNLYKALGGGWPPEKVAQRD